MAVPIPVSVIIPTYNRAGLVQEAVASVLAQTWRDFEVLVVDDGGSDGTDAALAPYASRLRLLRRESRGGVSAARNTGIEAARGEWLAFLDSDDLWLPEKLARQMAYLAAHPDLLLCQTEETWVRRGLRVNQPLSHRKVGIGDRRGPTAQRVEGVRQIKMAGATSEPGEQRRSCTGLSLRDDSHVSQAGRETAA